MLACPRPEFDVAVQPGEDGDDSTEVVVTARTLVRDLLLQAGRLDPAAEADRGLLTLLPGEQAVVRVTGCPGLTAEAARTALFCVETA